MAMSPGIKQTDTPTCNVFSLLEASDSDEIDEDQE